MDKHRSLCFVCVERQRYSPGRTRADCQPEHLLAVDLEALLQLESSDRQPLICKTPAKACR